MDDQIRQRFTIVYWALGALLGLVIALLGTTVTQSYQLGQTIGRLDVLIDHVTLR